jgi:anti-anti-sigma regulatory factor
MKLTVNEMQGRVPVTVLGVQGDLDGSTYTELIAKGKELCAAGPRDIVLDLSGMPYMSSAGLVALHSVAMMARGQQPPDPESGWEAFRAIARDQTPGTQQRVKLLSPTARVAKVLDTTGFTRFFDVHTDLATAVASF